MSDGANRPGRTRPAAREGERVRRGSSAGPAAWGGEAGEGHERIASGIRRLDHILTGGLIRGGIYAVIGPPGGGKTIFGNQFCFNFIDRYAGRCVYLTLLVESHAKMASHLSVMSFFRRDRIPDAMYYVSGYEALRSGGLPALLNLVRQTLRSRKAGLFVVDGFEGIEQMGAGPREIREFVNQLQSFTAVLGTTTLLLSSLRDRRHPENALVDGVIELSDQLIGPRAVRELTVHKFRGSDYLRGRHEVEITSDGMVIHPRTEIQFDEPPGAAEEERVRMAFGVERLDDMLAGGLPSGSTAALVGSPGTGKTTLGLKFLSEGARQGQQGIYFGFYEPPPRLIEKAESLGIDLARHVKGGRVKIVWQAPLEHMMDSLAEQLLEQIRENPRARRRLFIDGMEGFRAAAVYQDRIPRFLSALTNQLRTSDVTTLVSEELDLFSPEVRMPNPELAHVVESVIALRYVELRSQLYRLISILKMRESPYDSSIREFRIRDGKIEVAESFESAEAILTGHARLSRGNGHGARGGAVAAEPARGEADDAGAAPGPRPRARGGARRSGARGPGKRRRGSGEGR